MLLQRTLRSPKRLENLLPRVARCNALTDCKFLVPMNCLRIETDKSLQNRDSGGDILSSVHWLTSGMGCWVGHLHRTAAQPLGCARRNHGNSNRTDQNHQGLVSTSVVHGPAKREALAGSHMCDILHHLGFSQSPSEMGMCKI